MNSPAILTNVLTGIAIIAGLLLVIPHNAYAHCDTLDGPVIQDAIKAIDAKDITPVLKWVKPEDEKAVRAAFQKIVSGEAKSSDSAKRNFFETLIRIHRAGEGAPFTGLKPAGTTEPAIAEADKALKTGSPEALVKLVTDDVASGIRKHFEQAASTFKHKDESVAKGREFVEAYVAFTHYVERLRQDAVSKDLHGEHDKHGNTKKHKKEYHHN